MDSLPPDPQALASLQPGTATNSPPLSPTCLQSITPLITKSGERQGAQPRAGRIPSTLPRHFLQTPKCLPGICPSKEALRTADARPLHTLFKACLL